MLSPDFEAREYQSRIAETAARYNTLVVLPTGLGKTMVAVLVASTRLRDHPGSKVMVLAPTKPLVLQHYGTFRKLLKIPASEMVALTGTVDPGQREVLWLKARAIFATPQTIFNDVKRGRVSLRDVVLAVFDEAHRCVKDYTYTRLAQAYKSEASNPLILGLTASPGGSSERVREIKENLFIDRVEARTEESPDVRTYVEKTAIEVVKVRVPAEYYELVLRIRELFNEKVNRLVSGGFLKASRVSKRAILEARGTISARLRTAQASGGQKGYIFGAILNQAQAIVVLHALEVIETQGPSTLVRYLQRVKDRPDKGKAVSALVKDPRWTKICEEADKVIAIEHPKMTSVRMIVADQMKRKPDSRVIVFTQYRDTIEELVGALEKDGHFSRKFVGQADREGDEGMDQGEQGTTLREFTDGKFNVLVSSSIGEEGLHVPDVDLVVFYEAVPSEIRFIQRRGRTGRTTPGRAVILLSEGTVDESYYYSALRKETKMREIVDKAQQSPVRRRPGRNPTLLDFVVE